MLNIQSLERIPIPSITIDNRSSMNKIEELVTQIIACKKQNSKADTNTLEAHIDQLVYHLYGLTPEEIAVVEGSENK